MLKLFCAVIFVVPTAACGQPASDQNLARAVATQVKQDCLSAKSQAPDAAFAHHLERLCECTESKILASQSKDAGSEVVDRRKALDRAVQEAIKECDAELGGIADLKDYKATGIQPPAISTSP